MLQFFVNKKDDFGYFAPMFKRVLFVFILFIALVSCYGPSRDCQAFKTGEFLFDYQIGDSLKQGRFIRGENFSVDYYENKVDSASIRWINDCEFVLQDLKSKVGIHYKIIKTTDSSYTFEYKNAVKDPNRKVVVKTGTAVRLK